MRSATKKTPKTVDAYMAALSADARATLEKIRDTIRAAAPNSIEVIGYGIPIVKTQGMLVGFAAFKNHCSFFPMSKAVIKRYASDLKRYEMAKGTIRFPIGHPPPATLIKKMVKARLAEKKADLKSSAPRTSQSRSRRDRGSAR